MRERPRWPTCRPSLCFAVDAVLHPLHNFRCPRPRNTSGSARSPLCRESSLDACPVSIAFCVALLIGTSLTSRGSEPSCNAKAEGSFMRAMHLRSQNFGSSPGISTGGRNNIKKPHTLSRIHRLARNTEAATLSPMRRILAIVFLVLLPIQFSWAAVGAYCGHEATAKIAHFGHHEHQHVTGASTDSDSAAELKGDKAAAVLDLDCGHCHGTCSVMLTVPLSHFGSLIATPPRSTSDDTGGAHAPTRPERPQWVPFA